MESIALQGPGVHRAALVSHQGRRVLVLEPTRHAPRPDLSRLAQDLAWAHVDEILLEAAIPVDARHNAKVDYRALLARLNGRRAKKLASASSTVRRNSRTGVSSWKCRES